APVTADPGATIVANDVANFNKNMNIKGTVTLVKLSPGDSMTVSEPTNLNDNVTIGAGIANSLNVNATSTFFNPTNFNSTANFGNAVNLGTGPAQSINVRGNATFTGNIVDMSAVPNVKLPPTAAVSGMNVSGTAKFTGAVDMSTATAV